MARKNQRILKLEAVLKVTSSLALCDGFFHNWYFPKPTIVCVFIIYHQTREIALVAIAMTPCREFVRQQLIEFGEQPLKGKCVSLPRWNQFGPVSTERVVPEIYLFGGLGKKPQFVMIYKCALQIKYTVAAIMRPKFENQYDSVRNASFSISHGVGIDTGTVLAVRAGARGDNDLIWIGRST